MFPQKNTYPGGSPDDEIGDYNGQDTAKVNHRVPRQHRQKPRSMRLLACDSESFYNCQDEENALEGDDWYPVRPRMAGRLASLRPRRRSLRVDDEKRSVMMPGSRC